MTNRSKFCLAYVLIMLVNLVTLIIGPPSFWFLPIIIAVVVTISATVVSFEENFSTEKTIPELVVFKKLDKYIVIEADGIIFTLDDNNRIFHLLTEENKGQLDISTDNDFWGNIIKQTLKLNVGHEHRHLNQDKKEY